MTLFRRPKTSLWHYEFVMKGKRFRGTTRTNDKRLAYVAEAVKRREAAQAEEPKEKGTAGVATIKYEANPDTPCFSPKSIWTIYELVQALNAELGRTVAVRFDVTSDGRHCAEFFFEDEASDPRRVVASLVLRGRRLTPNYSVDPVPRGVEHPGRMSLARALNAARIAIYQGLQ